MSESDSDSDSSESPDSEYRRRESHHKRAKKKMLLEPDPPDYYDGSVVIRDFIKFVTEGTAYVRDGHVPSNRHVLKLSKYLKGKAYQFYLTAVADSPFDWRLKEFFTELYNYCFPLTYRLDQQCKAASSSTQSRMTSP